MRRVLVLIVVLVAPAFAGLRETTIVVPEGWVDTTANASAELAKARSLQGATRADLQSWATPDNSQGMVVIEMVGRIKGSSSREKIKGIENGAMESAKGSTLVSLTQRDEGNQVVVDHVFETGDERIHMIRRYGVSSDGQIHTIMVSCVAEKSVAAPACEASLTSAVVSIPNAIGLDETTEKAKEDFAYRLGQIVGVGLVVILILVWALRKKKS